MIKYVFWNNKGGTGKTSLIFQMICSYANKHKDKKILAIDLCPQANLSDLFLGGLINEGAKKLEHLHSLDPRKSVAGYFQDRIASPFSYAKIETSKYICNPSEYNNSIPSNIDLLAGDHMVEIQSNAIATLSNTNLPGVNAWVSVTNWINDFINSTNNEYSTVFIDTNPSFSSYTQIAIAAADRLILPVMPDDSSRRAVQNVFSLIHGVKLPSIYEQSAFSKRMEEAKKPLPKIHLIVKNRLTQYMGPASAYRAIFTAIDNDVKKLMSVNPNIFTFTNYEKEGVVEVRDFQTTGVVAFAKGLPFDKTTTGKHVIFDREPQVDPKILQESKDAINSIVEKL
ncbi:ParA family protein [Geobacillus stearothermophilus]|nr:ParA family protein [Geobacillus stearothermophilus]